jgi:hypothetical protein
MLVPTKVIGLVAALVLWGAGSASASVPHTEHATLGDWAATFSYVKKGGSLPAYSDLRIRVTHAGSVVLAAPVASSLRGVGHLLGPGGFQGHPSISFRDLDGNGSPELLLSLYTGGAHCCFLEQVFDFGSATPRKTEINFADSGAALVTMAGHSLFKSVDPSFAYAFTDFADSGSPVALWEYGDGRLTNVTRSFPGAIARDAASWWKAYRAQAMRKGDVRGLLAAWAADEASLGRAASARTTLARLARTGALDRGFGGAKGSSYVRALWRFLHKERYLS